MQLQARHVLLVIIFFLATLLHGQGRLPSRAFMENKGQVVDQNDQPNPDVLYLWEGQGYNVQLRTTGFSYDLVQVERASEPTASEHNAPEDANKPSCIRHIHRIDVELLGMSPARQVSATGPLTGHYNFYTPGVPYGGATNVKHYARVVYANAYPGIDVEFLLDEQQQFKYNFIVQPGADLAQVRLGIKGPFSTRLENGALVMSTRFGELQEEVPLSYWEVGGVRTAEADVRFVERGVGEYGLALEGSRPAGAMLVVDPNPVLMYATYYDGVNDEWQRAVCETILGWIVIAMVTEASPGLATSGATITDPAGDDDGLVACFDSMGTFRWATYAGGTERENIFDVERTNAGIIRAVGLTHSPALPSIDTLAGNHGDADGFIFSCSPLDGQAVSVHFIGGSTFDELMRIEGHPDGGFVVHGDGGAGLATPGVFSYAMWGDFISKYSSFGSVQWTAYIDTDCYSHEVRTALLVTPGGNVLSLYSCYSLMDTDHLLTWYSVAGDSTYQIPFDGPGDLVLHDAACLSDGRLVVVGRTTDSLEVTTDAHDQDYSGPPPDIAGGKDGFIQVMDTLGQITFCTYVGGESWEWLTEVVGLPDGGYITVGQTSSEQEIAMTNGTDTTHGQGWDIFVSRYTTDNQRVWSSYFGTNVFEYPIDALVDQHQRLWLAVNGGVGLATADGYQVTPFGNGGPLLAKFSFCESSPPALGPIMGSVVSCPNSTTTYSVGAVPGADHYWWIAPQGSSIAAGQGTNTVELYFGGIPGSLRVMALDSCSAGPETVLAIDSLPGAPTVVTPAGPLTGCAGTPVQLTASGANQYTWSNGATGAVLSISAWGSYFAVGTNALGCSDTSDVVSVWFEPLPDPTITGAQTAVQGAIEHYTAPVGTGTYSWSVTNGNLLMGQNSTVMTAQWNNAGVGSVVLVRASPVPCTDSDTLLVSVAPNSLEDLDVGGLTLYPSPAGAELFIDPPEPCAALRGAQVHDAAGRLVLQLGTGAGCVRGDLMRLPTNTLMPGWYTVRLQGAQSTYAARFVVVSGE